jgi:NAD(P)-dependent dehydrogenase (short-subunit alcohol dehydrogenase family)
MADNVTSTENILNRFRLDGRTALVTGGAQGIGRAFAHALGEAGAKIAVVDINDELGELVVSELENKEIEAIYIHADVTKESDIKMMVDRIIQTWGILSIGINNAGIGVWKAAMEMDSDTWNRIMKINQDAVFFCAREESKVMKQNGYGKIINTASMSAHISNTPQNQAAYNTSKAAVLHLTRSLAAEWAPHGIRVNSISPGYTKTALVEDLLATPEGKKMKDCWMPKIPLGAMAEVTDLQGAAVFLASPASDYMTGADILIDGGYCTW